MKRSKFSDERNLAIVREGGAGRKVADLHAPGTSLMWRLQKEASVAALWMRRTSRGADLCLEVDGRQQFTMTASLEDVGMQSLRLRHRLEDVGWREPQFGV